MRNDGIATRKRIGKVRTEVKTNKPMAISMHSSEKNPYTPQRFIFQIAVSAINRAKRKTTRNGLNQLGK